MDSRHTAPISINIGLRIAQIFGALLALKMDFDPETLVVGVNEAESVAAKTVYMTPLLVR